MANPMSPGRSPVARPPSFHIVPRSKEEYAAARASRRSRGVSSVSMGTQDSDNGAEGGRPPPRLDSKTAAMLADDDSDIDEGSVVERIDTTITPFRPDGSLRGASFNNLVGLGPGASMYLSPEQRQYLTRAASRAGNSNSSGGGRSPTAQGGSGYGSAVGRSVQQEASRVSPQQRGSPTGRGSGASPSGMKRQGTGLPFTYAAAGVAASRAAPTKTGVEASARAISKSGSGRVGGGKVQPGRGGGGRAAQQAAGVPVIAVPSVRTAYTRARSQ